MTTSEQRALIALSITLLASTLLIASAPRWASPIASVLAVLAAAPLVGSRRSFTRMPALLMLLWAALAATVLQLLPLPAALVEIVAPARFAMEKSNAAAYGGAMPAFFSITQDGAATLRELVKLVGYLALGFVSLRLAHSRQARRWILVTVAITGAVVALCALGHRVLGARSLLGIYQPQVVYSVSLSPFLNPNHLAGYLAFVTPIALGLALHRRSFWFAAIAVLCGVASLMAVSRGGLVSLSVGVVTVVVLFSLVPNSGGRHYVRRWVAIVLGLVFVGGAIFGATAGSELLDLDLKQERDAGKFLAWESAPAYLDGALWTGAGRGAFEANFPRVQPHTGVTFSHIENEYLQVVLDWGLLMALLLFVLAVRVAREILNRRPTSALAFGAIGGVTAMLVQNLVDFGMELPGQAMPAIAVLAVLAPGSLRTHDKAVRTRWLRGRRIGLLCLGIIVCGMGASALGNSAGESIRCDPSLRAPTDADEVLKTASRLALRHPGDYQVPALAARRLHELRDSRGFRVLARALDANPNHWAVHFLAARMLASSQSRSQALGAYRRALRLPGRPAAVLESLVASFPEPAQIVAALPEEPELVMQHGKALMRLERLEAASLLLDRSLSSGVSDPDLLALAAQLALRRKQLPRAVSLASKLDVQENSVASLTLRVRVLQEAGEQQATRDLIRARIALKSAHAEPELALLLILAKLELELGDPVSARALCSGLLHSPRAGAKLRRQIHLQLAIVEDHVENKHQADWHRSQAEALKNH